MSNIGNGQNQANRQRIVPLATIETYRIETHQVEEFVQTQINTLLEAAKLQGKTFSDINVTVFSLGEASRKFIPFVAILPRESLEGNRRNGGDELDIFNPSDDDGARKLIPPVWAAIQSLTYGKDDRNAFHSPTTKQQLQLSGEQAKFIAGLTSPRVERKGDTEFVMVLLDPLRVFAAMVKKSSSDNGFMIEINKSECLQGSDYVYSFSKVPRRQNRKNRDLIKEIDAGLVRALRANGARRH